MKYEHAIIFATKETIAGVCDLASDGLVEMPVRLRTLEILGAMRFADGFAERVDDEYLPTDVDVIRHDIRKFLEREGDLV